MTVGRRFEPGFTASEGVVWADGTATGRLRISFSCGQVDIVVIGSGVTGLSAATNLVRGRRIVVVL